MGGNPHYKVCMLQQWLEKEACVVLNWTWVGKYSLLQGMYVTTMARERGMSCGELDWDWEVFSVTRQVCHSNG